VLDEALKYCNTFAVIPVQARGKRPLIKWEKYASEKPSADQVRKWWGKYPDANIGIITGGVSGITVIDIDSDEGIGAFAKLVGQVKTPTVYSPRGGLHHYFRYDGGRLKSRARILPGVDVRNDGGFIIAPPSIGENGEVYEWSPRCNLSHPFAVLPDSVFVGQPPVAPASALAFQEGSRNENVFSTAFALAKGGMPFADAEKVISAVSAWCNPPLPYNEAMRTLQSAYERASRKERNLTQEVRELVATYSVISATDCYKELQLATQTERSTLRTILARLCKEGVLAKEGVGRYRVLDREVEIMDFVNASTEEFPVVLPLGLNDLVRVSPKNIIIVGGASNAGKTAFLLNIIKDNMNRFPLDYLNSEMGAGEMRRRLENFQMPLEDWKFTAIERDGDFPDLITGEEKIWIIDYLDVTDEFWKVATTIKQIHERLDRGICIIALQKKDKSPYARGGEGTLEKSRLYVTLDHEDFGGRITIVKAKSYRTEANPNGMVRMYHIEKGSRFEPISAWMR